MKSAYTQVPSKTYQSRPPYELDENGFFNIIGYNTHDFRELEDDGYWERLEVEHLTAQDKDGKPFMAEIMFNGYLRQAAPEVLEAVPVDIWCKIYEHEIFAMIGAGQDTAIVKTTILREFLQFYGLKKDGDPVLPSSVVQALTAENLFDGALCHPPGILLRKLIETPYFTDLTPATLAKIPLSFWQEECFGYISRNAPIGAVEYLARSNKLSPLLHAEVWRHRPKDFMIFWNLTHGHANQRDRERAQRILKIICVDQSRRQKRVISL